MQIRAVIFDMDGVLFDTEWLCMDSWIHVARKMGLEDMETFFPTCIGRNLADTAVLFRKFYGKDRDYEQFRQQASVRFREYIAQNGIPMKSGVRELLAFLRRKDYRIGLASSSSRRSVEEHLRLSGLREYFQSLTTGDMVEHSKPRPDIYLMACESLGVNPAQTIAIEDSPNGIRAAYSAG